MLLLWSILAGLALLVMTSSTLLAIGASGWVVFPGVIVAVHSALRRPFYDAALTMLVVAWAADMLSSGPPGLHGLLLTVVFFAVYAVGQRVGGRYLIATFALATGAAMSVALAESLAVGLLYTDASALSLFARSGVASSVLTGVLAVPYSALLGGLERLWASRTERGVIVD